MPARSGPPSPLSHVPDIIAVRHPSPVRFLPQGCQRERLLFVSVTTPVRLRGVDVAEMRLAVPPAPGPAHAGFGNVEDWNTPLWHHGGRYWARLGGTRAEGRHRSVEPLSATALAALLTDPRPQGWHEILPRWDLFERRFARTPLKGWHDVRPPGVTGENLGCLTLPAGRVVEDLADLSRAAVARLFEEDVIVSGGEAFAAFEGVHAIAVPDHATAGFPPEILEATLSPRHATTHDRARNGFCFRVDREGEMRAFVDGRPKWSDRSSASGAGAERLWLASERIDDEADVVRMANDLVGRVLRVATQVPGAVDLAAVAALLPWVARAGIGAVAAEEAPEALRAVQAASDAIAPLSGNGRVQETLSMAHRYAGTVGLPALARRLESRLDPDDALAMAGIPVP